MRGGRCGARAIALRVLSSPTASPRGHRAAAERAHSAFSAVRPASCVGRVPLRLLPYWGVCTILRARGAPARGERVGGGVERCGRWALFRGQVRRVCQPYTHRHLAPPPHTAASPRRGKGGGRARRAHRSVSTVRAASCVGRVPLRPAGHDPDVFPGGLCLRARGHQREVRGGNGGGAAWKAGPLALSPG